jgi:hypothetical protein
MVKVLEVINDDELKFEENVGRKYKWTSYEWNV